MTEVTFNNKKNTNIPNWIIWFGVIVMIGAPL